MVSPTPRNPPSPPAAQSPQPAVPGLAESSVTRLAADGTALVLGTIGGVLTARWLGPSGKGTLAALTFLGGLIGQLCGLGLGDATVVWVRGRGVTGQRVLSAAIGAALLASLAGAGIFAGLSSLELGSDFAGVGIAVAIGCAGLPFVTLCNVMGQTLNSEERFNDTSLTLLMIASTTTVAIVLLVVILDLGVTGAVLAGTLGAGIGAVYVALRLRRLGYRWRPALDRALLRDMLPYGVRIQMSSALTALTGRADLLVVYAITGSAAAGQYSVALTVAAIVGMAPLAIAYVSFPRIAGLPVEDARDLIDRAGRTVVVVALIAALIVASLAPVGVALAFGPGFRAAVVPTVILCAGFAVGSLQWLLTRAAAAGGNASVSLWSYGWNVLVMLALDFGLIPGAGITGAAVASLAGAGAGLAVGLQHHRAGGSWSSGVRRLVPRAADMRAVVHLTRTLHR